MADSDSDVYIGSFWLPQEGEGSAVEGMMLLHDEGATVHLPRLLSEEELDDSVIFAKLKGHHGHATLFNCYGSWTKDRNGLIVKARVSSTLVALGCAADQIGGEALAFRMPGSEHWLDDACFQVIHSDDGHVSILFKASERHELALSPHLKLDRIYAAAISSDTSGVEGYAVERKMTFKLRSDYWLALGSYWDLIWALRRFFEFVTQSQLPVETVTLYNDIDKRDEDLGVLIHRPTSAFEGLKFPKRKDFLIHAHEIRGQIDGLICRWMRSITSNPAPFIHYFHAFDRRRQDRVLHFIWNVAALEELHKMRYGRHKTDLIERLREMVHRWKDAFNQLPDDTVLQHIKDSRHYHAHAAGDLRAKAAKGWWLFRYGDFLMALSNLEILSLIGIDQASAIKLTRHNNWMREALDLTTYPGPDE